VGQRHDVDYLGWALALALVLAAPASGLSLLLEGPSTGPFGQGLAVEEATSGDTITLTISLDLSVSLNGYDLLLTWDPTELALLAASDLTGLGLDVNPTSGVGFPRRVATISLGAVTGADLVALQFRVVSVVRDGAADFSFATNGSGLSPGSLVLAAPPTAAIAIPEPALPILLLLGLLGLQRSLRSDQ
jgi:hypothetical protein